MQHRFFSQLEQVRATHERFVIATVIAVRGSSSAKPGAHALISAEGQNLFGWVGGGCAESYVIEQSLEALAQGQPRVVTVDLDDELLGVGMPCGGMMDVFIEPVLPRQQLMISGDSACARSLCVLGSMADLAVTVFCESAPHAAFPLTELVARPLHASDLTRTSWLVLEPDLAQEHIDQLAEIAEGICSARARPQGVVIAPLQLGAVTPREHAVAHLAALCAHHHRANACPLSRRPLPTGPAPSEPVHLLAVGRGRIVEELVRLGHLLEWRVTVNHPNSNNDTYPTRTCLVSDDLALELPGAGPDTYLVIASQHKGDHQAAMRALSKRVAYIGLVASRKRAGLVEDWLGQQGIPPEQRTSLYAPAGLDLGGKTPFEIALSIVCEILVLHSGQGYQPIHERGN